MVHRCGSEIWGLFTQISKDEEPETDRLEYGVEL